MIRRKLEYEGNILVDKGVDVLQDAPPQFFIGELGDEYLEVSFQAQINPEAASVFRSRRRRFFDTAENANDVMQVFDHTIQGTTNLRDVQCKV